MLQTEEITQYVVNALGRHRSRNDIVQYLCEQKGMTWPDAEKLVKQIEVKHGSEINSRQSPLIIVLGIIGLIAGCALIAYCGLYFLSFANRSAVGMARSSRSAIFAIGALITGFGMITGAVIGMWKTIKAMFEHKENR